MILKRWLKNFLKFLFSVQLSVNFIREKTVKGTGVDLKLLINDAKKSMPSIHDIKIHFKSDLHNYLKEKGHQAARKNNLILLQIPLFDANITAKASVYPRTVQIDLACTTKPYHYNKEGAQKLAHILYKIHAFLCVESGHRAKLPETGTWIMTHYHMGQDSNLTYDGERFHITCEEATGGFTRVYDKIINGNRIVRIEEIRRPMITVKAELSKMTQEIKIQ